MTAKHTPAPWSINNWTQATTDIAIGAVGTPWIAKIPLRDVSINEQKANAHLIAAAPNLLAALDAMLANPNDPRCWANGRAAVAKAKGEAQ